MTLWSNSSCVRKIESVHLSPIGVDASVDKLGSSGAPPSLLPLSRSWLKKQHY